MKTLEQLGISPAPWRADTDKWGSENDVLCEYTRDSVRKGERRTKVVARCNAHFETFKADVHLVAAAPELYDMLQSLVEYIDRECIPCGETACELMAAAHNVLAKAAGESEVKR